MKLKKMLSADYDPQTKVFTFIGENQIGESAKVELPVDDPHIFMGWISAALYEKYDKSDGTGKGLIADNFEVSAHVDAHDRTNIAFKFAAGDLRLAFVVPVATQAPARLQSIKAHLDQAIAEMMNPQDPTVQ